MSPYQRPVRFAWWWGHRAYTLFVIRELTSIFIAAYAVLLLLLLRSLSQGPEAYAAYLQFLTAPGMVLFHVVALAAAVFHAVTWFGLAPSGIAVRVGDRAVPGRIIVGANYAAWIVISAIIAWIVLGA
jgi:fumarate reductase subunit C